MKKSLLILAVLAFCGVVRAQEKTVFDGEDLLLVFREYNPAVLQNAANDSTYGRVLQDLVQHYSVPRTEQNGYELIALAKNFDNSLMLQLLRKQYLHRRTLENASGLAAPMLKEDMMHDVQVVLQDVFKNTLAVKNLQLKNEKKKLKELRKNKNLSAQEKQNQTEQLRAQINQTKQDIRLLKQDTKQKIKATAQAYLDKLEAQLSAAQQGQSLAQESSSYDVKANHKKPVAE